MKLIKVTDTQGRVWRINRDWILRIIEDGTATRIEFAIVLRNHQSQIEFMGMVVKESVEVLAQLCGTVDHP